MTQYNQPPTSKEQAEMCQEDVQMLAIDMIIEEREKQDNKWGVQRHSWLYWNGILCEEAGEVSKAVIELEGNNTDVIKKEVTHIAAVAVAWLEHILEKENESQKP